MPLNEGRYNGEFLLSEANGTRSREQVTVTQSGTAIPAGTVMGQITVGTVASAAFAGNTGNGVLGTVTLSAGAKAGVYKLVVIEPNTNLGAFVVEDPDGVILGRGTVGTAFSAGGLAFTLADGATDFVAGDGFNITVAAGSGKWVPYVSSATNGSQVAAAILYNDLPVATGDVETVIVARDAEVSAADLTGLDNPARVTLAARGIIVR
jgi:hypothetical protein